MANRNILPPRIAFTRPVKNERTGEVEQHVVREWWHYLLQLKLSVDEVLTLVISEGGAPNNYAQTAEAAKRANAAYLLGFRPQNNAQLREVEKKTNEALLLGRLSSFNAQIRELRKKINEVELLAWLPDRGTNSGSDVTLDCETVEAVGYWSPVTDADTGDIIYSDNQVVMGFICADA